MSEALPLVAVGAGNRTRGYVRHAVTSSPGVRIVAVAEPDAQRRDAFAREFEVPEAGCFASYEDLVAAAPEAAGAINGTMDELHHASTTALLEAGYHVLLEKPIARTLDEVRSLAELAESKQRILMICHVLRYAPFYAKLKRLLDEGYIGQIRSMNTSEHVAYHHFATAFVRGKWNRREINPVLLAKCCHDLDLISWFVRQPVQHVSSLGRRSYFTPENAPPGSTDRCMDGCSVESSCMYSAPRIFVDRGLWPAYAFADLPDAQEASRERKLEVLRDPANPYGRCVWRCDNDVVDHQHVLMEFADGVSASHDLFAAAARGTRRFHILGTTGELEGDFKAGLITGRRMCLHADGVRMDEEETFDIHAGDSEQQGGHGGGDQRLVNDFLSVLRGQAPSEGYTHIRDSITSHEIAFAADRAMCEQRVVAIDEL